MTYLNHHDGRRKKRRQAAGTQAAAGGRGTRPADGRERERERGGPDGWRGVGPRPNRPRDLAATGTNSRRSSGRILLYCSTFAIRARVPTHVGPLAFVSAGKPGPADSPYRSGAFLRPRFTESCYRRRRSLSSFCSVFPGAASIVRPGARERIASPRDRFRGGVRFFIPRGMIDFINCFRRFRSTPRRRDGGEARDRAEPRSSSASSPDSLLSGRKVSRGEIIER